jgi:DNA-binding response OmpR family regulator
MQLQSCSVRTRRIAVVDPRPSDYSALLEAALEIEVRLEFLRSGRDALRLSRMEGADLWVINPVLPDMSGLDLCTMLRGHLARPVIYVIADRYRADDERAARIRGAALFGCKPVQMKWFDMWCRAP